MKLPEIIKHIDAVSIPENAKITQLKHEEDDEPYQVWRIDSDDAKYILKEAKENEYEIHQSIFAALKEGVPALYQVIDAGAKKYLLMEYRGRRPVQMQSFQSDPCIGCFDFFTTKNLGEQHLCPFRGLVYPESSRTPKSWPIPE